jgi:ubiquitin
MTEASCKRYQLQEYGQACSGCQQMNVPAINFVKEAESNRWIYHRLCAYCGTEDSKRFKKGVNRICIRCSNIHLQSPVNLYNPNVRIVESKFKYKRGEIITLECPQCHEKREVKFQGEMHQSGFLICASCIKKAPTSICRECGRKIRLTGADKRRDRLRLCIYCYRKRN